MNFGCRHGLEYLGHIRDLARGTDAERPVATNGQPLRPTKRAARVALAPPYEGLRRRLTVRRLEAFRSANEGGCNIRSRWARTQSV
jgi:hypothetical protein